MKLRIVLNDSREKSKEIIGDGINFLYLPKYIEVSLINGEMMENIWTADLKIILFICERDW